LALGLPRAVTASTGLDALTQVIEPYVGLRANAMTDLFCVEGIRCAAGALPRVWEDGGDRHARTIWPGPACWAAWRWPTPASARCTALRRPVGGMFPVPHGAACAALLPHAIAVNIAALRARAPASQALSRYDEVARLLTGRSQATAEDGVRWTADICRKLEIPPLRAYGVTQPISPTWWRKPRKPAA